MMRRSVNHRLWALLCAIVMLLSMLPPALATGSLSPAVSNNRNKQDYTVYASTVKSHLYVDGDQLVRVEYINGKIIVESYDSSFTLLESRTIPMELSIWGGFFAGKTYNFFIFGQANSKESDSVEVIRVVQYSKDWQRLGQASLKGANTTVPFDAGSLRCDEYGGYLYIRTCHEMYKSDDDRNHQANMTIAVKQSDMTISDAYYDVMNASYGYISHSFNQHIIVDEEGYIVALDHGDAHPRGVAFTRYYSKADTGKFSGSRYSAWCSSGVLLEFAGAVGANTTGGSVGGLGETSSCYVMAYSYDGAGSTGPRAAYYHYMDKASGKSWSVQLTNTVGVTTPVLAPTGLDGGYVLWNGKSGGTVNDTLSYIRYGADGKPGQIQTATAPLSDCQPIFYNGKLVWYVTSNSAPTFYTLDSSGVKAIGATSAAVDPDDPSPTPTPDPEPAEPFTDVDEDDYYYDAVVWAYENEITTGVTTTTFGPFTTCTREQAMTFLWRAAGCPEPSIARNPFTDIKSTDYSYKAILWAYGKGITTGMTTTTFGPQTTCSRAHLITFLWRSEDEPKAKGGQHGDYGDTWYSDAAAWADSYGVLNGTAQAFTPGANCPRADMMVYMYRTLAENA